ncbi:unnamed protein product [Ilex paraguariensis]|uniref:Mitotic checkpoint protein bub3 n=1 Tax=Ilex paraguariensis TaxID=185542 RepID=A0ABC8U6G1_9AQUA
MNGACLKFEKPIRDSISRIRFAPQSNNLLISSWDASLRLYDVGSYNLRLETPTEAALLDCCFPQESVAFTTDSDGYIRRCDLQYGINEKIGSHDDLATCVEYSDETWFVVGSIDGRVALKYIYSFNSGNDGYVFRCQPKAKDGRHHLAAVNDISFSPSICGTFVTGDDKGHVITWDAKSKKRLFELPRHLNSIASLSYNCGGQLLAVASSFTYQEANELEEPPQIYIHEMDERYIGSGSASSSSNKT